MSKGYLTATSEVKAPALQEDGSAELSIYQDQAATAEDVANEYMRLAFAYTNLSKLTDQKEAGFMKVFAEAVQFNGLTKRQLHEAVLNCIANKHQYGELQIADITGFDKKIKLYTHAWACDKEGFTASKLRDAKGNLWWVKLQDKEKADRIWEQIENKS